MNTPSRSIGPAAPGCMFVITTREDPTGRVVMIGKPTRKRARALINIPLCQATKEQLEEKLVGSLAMGTSALIEWALKELTRQGVTLEAWAKS
jgi:hypothetical protein